MRGRGIQFVIAIVVALVSLVSYFSTSSKNPVTGENQRIGINREQEIALGLQAAPQMIEQFGGESVDPKEQQLVDEVGAEIVKRSAASKTGYPFEFHVLNDSKTINAFALPGGQIFITRALLNRLETRGQLAAVLGHEIGHVVGRHGAEHMAKQQLTQGLTGAAVLATYDPEHPNQASAQIAMLIGGLVNMKFGREDELESDRLGIKFMTESQYDPHSMMKVMEILKAAGGGARQPEFFSTHPNPENRLEKIQQAIKDLYPNGLPTGLAK